MKIILSRKENPNKEQLKLLLLLLKLFSSMFPKYSCHKFCGPRAWGRVAARRETVLLHPVENKQHKFLCFPFFPWKLTCFLKVLFFLRNSFLPSFSLLNWCVNSCVNCSGGHSSLYFCMHMNKLSPFLLLICLLLVNSQALTLYSLTP